MLIFYIIQVYIIKSQKENSNWNCYPKSLIIHAVGFFKDNGLQVCIKCINYIFVILLSVYMYCIKYIYIYIYLALAYL